MTVLHRVRPVQQGGPAPLRRTEPGRPPLDVAGFGHVLDGVPTQVLVADADLIIRYANPATCAAIDELRAYLPFTSADVVGMAIDTCFGGILEATSPGNHWAALPLSARQEFGEETVEFKVDALYDDVGVRIGAIASPTRRSLSYGP